MIFEHRMILIGLIITIAIVYYIHSKITTEHMIDNFFIKHIVQGNDNFTHVTLKPYYTKGYYIQYHCGRNVYHVRDITIDSIYGAKIQSVVDDICFNLGLPKGSMQYKIQKPATVVITLNPDVKVATNAK